MLTCVAQTLFSWKILPMWTLILTNVLLTIINHFVCKSWCVAFCATSRLPRAPADLFWRSISFRLTELIVDRLFCLSTSPHWADGLTSHNITVHYECYCICGQIIVAKNRLVLSESLINTCTGLRFTKRLLPSVYRKTLSKIILTWSQNETLQIRLCIEHVFKSVLYGKYSMYLCCPALIGGMENLRAALMATVSWNSGQIKLQPWRLALKHFPVQCWGKGWQRWAFLSSLSFQS